MGTRADFYVGKEKMEWIGSVAWDGYPDGFDKSMFNAKDEKTWRDNIKVELDGRSDATYPENGWPWPWEDSGLTDCVYTFHKGIVWHEIGGYWCPLNDTPRDEDGYYSVDHLDSHDYDAVNFPNMEEIQKVTFGKRSGVIIVKR